MGLRERLGFQPEAQKPPLTPGSFEEMIDVARAQGVRDFIALQPFDEYLQDQEGYVRSTTRYYFTTRSGRHVEFSESYGIHPESHQTQLRGFLTARKRYHQIVEATEKSAYLINGWFGEADSVLNASKMDLVFQVHLMEDARREGVEAFDLPIDQSAT